MTLARQFPWRYPLLLLLSLMALGQPLAGYAQAEALPNYACIAPNVLFWKNIYGRYSLAQGVIHDKDDLSVIYEVVSFAAPQWQVLSSGNKAMVEQTKAKYRAILKTLAAGRAPMTADEKRVLALFGPNPKPQALLAARGNMRFQLGQKERFREGVIRSGAYLESIRRIFADHNLPADLCYLPHVESSYDYRAYSKSGAAGIWQFTRDTGRRYLVVNNSLDERLDPLRATEAAALFLKNNYKVLGDWSMAITAYNHGTTGMCNARKKKGCYETIFKEFDGQRFGFASRNFYSEFLAAREVAKNYRQYFGPLQLARPVRTQSVRITNFTPVRDLARHFGLTMDTVRQLNPALRDSVLLGRKLVPKGYQFHIPATSNGQLVNPGSKVASQTRAALHRQP